MVRCASRCRVSACFPASSAAEAATEADAPSRAAYRREAVFLGRLFRMPETRIAQAALDLCASADPDSLEAHVGWYLLEDEGRTALRHALPGHRGVLALWLSRHRFALLRGLSWVVNTAASLLFLRAGYTLWLLPVFVPVAGCVLRALLRRLYPPRELPRLALDTLSEDMRTLIVLPAVLRDRHDAIRAVRNDKRDWADLRLMQEMCAAEPYGVRRLGDEESAKKIKPRKY